MIRTALVSLSLALLPACSGLSATARHAPALRLQPRPRFAVPLRCAAAEGEAFDAPVPPSSTLPPAQQQSGGDRRVAVSGLSPQRQAGQRQQEQYSQRQSQPQPQPQQQPQQQQQQQRNLQNFFRMHKLLKIFSLEGENHSQKTSKSDGFFPENHCRTPPRLRRVL